MTHIIVVLFLIRLEIVITTYGHTQSGMMCSAWMFPGPLRLVVSPQGRVVVFSGQSTEITCSAVGYHSTNVQWLHEPRGTPVAVSAKLKVTSTSEGLQITVVNPRPEDSQTFSCAARDHNGLMIKEMITFVVYGKQ